MFLIIFSSFGDCTVSIFLTPISNLSTFSSIHLVLSCSVCIIFKPSMAASSHFLQNQCVPNQFFARNVYSSSEILLHTIHTHAEHISQCKVIVSAVTVFLHFHACLGGAILDVDKFIKIKIFANHLFGGYIKLFHSTCPLPNCLFFSSIVVFTKTLENSLNYIISEDKLITPSCVHFTGRLPETHTRHRSIALPKVSTQVQHTNCNVL